MRKYIIARIDKYVTVNILTYLLTYLLTVSATVDKFCNYNTSFTYTTYRHHILLVYTDSQCPVDLDHTQSKRLTDTKHYVTYKD